MTDPEDDQPQGNRPLRVHVTNPEEFPGGGGGPGDSVTVANDESNPVPMTLAAVALTDPMQMVLVEPAVVTATDPLPVVLDEPIDVTGTVLVSNTSGSPIPVTAPSALPISGTVTISGTVPVSGTVGISGTPTVVISGTVPISGTVAISTNPVPVSGSVTATISGTPSVNATIVGTPSVNATLQGTPTVNVGTVSGTITTTYSGTQTVNVGNTPTVNVGTLPGVPGLVPTNVQLIAAGTYTSVQVSADQTNAGYRSAVFYLNVTTVTALQTITLTIEGRDVAASNLYFVLAQSSAISVIGLVTITLGGLGNIALPRTWRARVVHSGGGNFAYSLGASLLV